MEVRFVTSAPGLKGRPEPVLPEFAFVGRSNCGKSSLINLFLGRKALARTSGSPNRTNCLYSLESQLSNPRLIKFKTRNN